MAKQHKTNSPQLSNQARPGTDFIGVGVGALILNDQDQLLLTKRGPKAKNEVGKWEIPGGAVEFGETLQQAAKREVKEELGIKIEVLKLLHVVDHLIPDENQHWVAPTYICKLVSGQPKILEPEKCDQIDWFCLDQIDDLPLSIATQSDLKVLNREEQHPDYGLIPTGAYIIVQNQQNQVLLGKRKNSYKSGHYGFPGGKVGHKESMKQCAFRELKEETDLRGNNFKFIGVIREWQGTLDWFHFAYLCDDWTGQIKNLEKDKCFGWNWYDLDDLPQPILKGHHQGLELLQQKQKYVELL